MAQIRKVPADWQHPRSAHDFLPLRGYGWSFEDMCQEAADNGMPEFRREDWWGHYVEGRDCTHFQAYETITEGSPASPIFATEAEAESYVESGGIVKHLNQLHRQERPALAALSDDFEAWLAGNSNPAASAAKYAAAVAESALAHVNDRYHG